MGEKLPGRNRAPRGAGPGALAAGGSAEAGAEEARREVAPGPEQGEPGACYEAFPDDQLLTHCPCALLQRGGLHLAEWMRSSYGLVPLGVLHVASFFCSLDRSVAG